MINYSYHTHQYCSYTSKEGVIYNKQDLSFDNYLNTIWFSINELKNVLNRLKQESHLRGGTIYDHTNILVVSDHGFESFFEKDNHSKQLIFNMHEYLIQNNMMNRNEPNNLLKYYKTILSHFNPAFMYKPAKYKEDMYNKKIDDNNKINTFFNKTDLFSNSDIPYFIEEMAIKYNLYKQGKLNELNNKMSFFDNIVLNSPDTKLNNLINMNKIVLPILNREQTRNRSIVSVAGDWLWQPFKKHMKYNLISKLDFVSDSKGIFDSNKWTNKYI